MGRTRIRTNPKIKSRACCTCGTAVLGFVDLGLTWWVDAEPIDPPAAAVYLLLGRPLYRATIHHDGSGDLDWCNPVPYRRLVAACLRRGDDLPGTVVAAHDKDCRVEPGRRIDPPAWATPRPLYAVHPVDPEVLF